MRRKKHKHTRRAVSFYKINYGLHEPYKVLLDGNFIHATLSTNLGELDKHLPNLLGGRTKTFVTPCVMHELKGLGAEFRESAAAARRIQLHYCGHGRLGKQQPKNKQQKAKPEGEGEAAAGVEQEEDTGEQGSGAQKSDGPLAAADCLLEQVGAGNAQHWWVATQDKRLREALGKVPGTPVLFATINGIHLETPSEMAKSTARQAEEAGMALPQHERSSEVLRDLEEIRPVLRTSVKFRRNKAKGPNPLAAKKKVKKPPQQQQQTALAAAEGAAKAKRRRKRVRSAAQEEG